MFGVMNGGGCCGKFIGAMLKFGSAVDTGGGGGGGGAKFKNGGIF